MAFRVPGRGWCAAGLLLAAAVGGPAIAAPTFDEVMAAPDDLQLNLDYALAEAGAGNLLSAAATLERLLLLRPDWDSARYVYAVILYRLDDRRGAEQQFKMLENANLPTAQKAEVVRYQRLIARGGQGAVITGSVNMGANYDQDAYGAFYTQFDTLPGAKSEAGTTGLISGRVDAAWKLGPDSPLSAYASASGYSQTKLSGPDTGFQSGELRAGLSAVQGTGNWRLGAVARQYVLFGESYLGEYGAQAGAGLRLSPTTSLTGSFEAVRQEFDEPLVNAALVTRGRDGHDGSRYDANLGLEYRLAGQGVFGATIGYETKTADYEPFAYKAPYLRGRYSVSAVDGRYLNVSGGTRWVKYEAADPVYLANTRRKDVRTDLHVDLGAPLSALLASGPTGDELDNVLLQLGISYNWRDSSAPLAGYDSLGGQMLLIWRFGNQR